MTDSMIERVAMAICSNAGEKWNAANFNETGNGEEPEEQRDHWRGIARAAIEAMREPTDDMVEEFAVEASYAREMARAENYRLLRPRPEAIAECQWFPPAYRAMIDSILSEAQPTGEKT